VGETSEACEVQIAQVGPRRSTARPWKEGSRSRRFHDLLLVIDARHRIKEPVIPGPEGRKRAFQATRIASLASPVEAQPSDPFTGMLRPRFLLASAEPGGAAVSGIV